MIYIGAPSNATYYSVLVGTPLSTPYREPLSAHGATGSTETFDVSAANVHTATLDAACTFTFTGAVTGYAYSMTLVLTQDATGSRAVTWPTSVKWDGGTAPTMPAANKVSVLTFLTMDGGTTWYGFPSGLVF